MATEAQGVWAERAWLFIALCRQLEIDAGLITYTRQQLARAAGAEIWREPRADAPFTACGAGPRSPIVWICAALIDDKAYLFDARLGLEIPGPDGTGVATLEDAMSDPAILERMNLPGQSPYGTSRASLLGSPTKIGILLDSSRGYFSPKMKLLQRELGGEYRTILFRDPADQRDHFAQVLGENAGEIKLWSLPFEVETRLFTDGQFVASIQQSLFSVQARVSPDLRSGQATARRPGRSHQRLCHAPIRGKCPFVNNKKMAIPEDVQAGLDAYATYYLALPASEKALLANEAPEQARALFRNTLELLPEPGPNQPYYHMLRWGANANLGRIYEAKNDGCPGDRVRHSAGPDHPGPWQSRACSRACVAQPDGCPAVTTPVAPSLGRSRRRRRTPPPGRGPVRAPNGGN